MKISNPIIPALRSVILAALTITISNSAIGQGLSNTNRNGVPAKWAVNAFEHKVFIENKGQFDGKNDLKKSQIGFGMINDGLQVYFTSTGLTYKMEEWGKSEADQKRLRALVERERNESGTPSKKELREEEELKRLDVIKSSVIQLEWVGATPNTKITPENMVVEYYNYPDASDNSKSVYFAKAYKNITYKNLYPGIDVVYSFLEGKTGIKYALILHPGADLSKVKMKYTGADKISIDDQGNIRLGTVLGDIIDHAPLSFYQDNESEIKSSFQINGNEVSFKLNDFDNSKTVVIDPWTQNPAFAPTNIGFDVENDALGNVYVYGGFGPALLRKYSPLGVPLWSTNAIAPFYINWHGDLATDNAGNNFVSNGFANGMIQKINNAGVAVATGTNLSTASGTTWEFFNLCFNKAQTNLIGGATPGGHGVGNINQTTLLPTGYNAMGSFASSELRGLCASDNGNYYGICINSGTPGKVYGFTPAFGVLWNVNSGYTTADHGYWTPNAFNNPSAQNAICASKCFVYTYNGDSLKKRDINNGLLITQIKVAGATKGLCSGVIVDSCENVYVGTNTGVSKYDKNFNFVSSANTPGAVFDVVFSKINNADLFVSGNALVGNVTLVVPCPPSSLTINTFTAPEYCNKANASATVQVSGGLAPYTYTWTPSAQTTSVATGLSAGIYTVQIKDNSCNPLIKTATVQIVNIPPATVSIGSFTNVSCNGKSTGAASASLTGGTGPFTYTWNSTPAQNTATATNLPAGPYTVSVTDSKGCLSTGTVVITEPTPITTTNTSANVLCFGTSTGSASISSSGGTGVHTYSWTNGSTSATLTNIPAGNYSVFVTDANGCFTVVSVPVTQPLALTLTINSSTTNICAGSLINLNAFAVGGTGPFTYTWNPGPTTAAYNVTEVIPGTYNYILNCTDFNGCTISNNINLTFNQIPIISATSQTVCYGDKAVLTASGAEMYKWNPVNYSGSTFTINGVSNMYLTVVGTNTSTGCSSTPVTSTLIVNPIPVPAISASNNKGCVPLCMTFTASNTLGSIASCDWEFGDGGFASNLINTDRCFNMAGDYTVRAVVSDNNGCIGSTTYSLSAYPFPIADFNYAPIKPIINEEVNFTDATHGAVVKKWDWYFMNLPKPHSAYTNPNYIYSEAGTYAIALVVTSDHGCTDTIVKTIVVGEDYGIYVPNVFSPNGDGVNDVFQPKGFGITKYELRIFDRWGEQLMFTNDFAHGWDGMWKGKLSKEDTYIWKINLTNVFGKSHELSGHVILIK